MVLKRNVVMLLLCVSVSHVTLYGVEIYHRLETPLLSGEAVNETEPTADQYIQLQYTYTPELLKTINREATLSDTLFMNLEVQGVADTISSVVRYAIQLQPGTHELYFYPQQYGSIYAVRVVYYAGRVQDSSKIFSLGIRVQRDTRMHVRGYTVTTASLEDILHWRPTLGETHHRDFRLYRWQSYPDVLVLSFRSRDVQAKYLKRLAFFNEKRYTRGTLQDLRSIVHRQGWGAHDYKVEDIARFFTEASRLQYEGSHIQLTQEELLLLDILRDIGMIAVQANNSAYTVYEVHPTYPNSSIVSYARSDSPALQETLLYHELLHTYYFRDAELRDIMTIIWNRFSQEHAHIWRAFLSYNGYDSDYEYLVVNELFAYLLQRPIESLSWYVPARIIAESIPDIEQRRALAFTNAFIVYAQEISQYMFQKYSIFDGKVRYIWRY